MYLSEVDTPFGQNYDAGVINSRPELGHSLFAFNMTCQPVVVKTFPVCGCTTAVLTENVIAPFDLARVDLNVSTDRELGPHTERVGLYFEDGPNNWYKTAIVRYWVPRHPGHDDRS
jgi:hypothetical protein